MQRNDSTEKFVTDLHLLAKICERNPLKMVLLGLIIGMRDITISDKLQLDPN